MNFKHRLFSAILLGIFAGAIPAGYAFGQVCQTDSEGGCLEAGAICTVRTGVKGVCRGMAVPRREMRCVCEANPVFLLSVGTVTPNAVSSGQSASATISVTPIRGKGYHGTISLTCTVLGRGTGLACSANPSVLNISSDGPVAMSALTISTNATTSPGAYIFRITGVDANGAGPRNTTPPLSLAVVTKGIQNVSLVREQSTPAVYLIVGDTKFWIMDPTEFAVLGFDWDKVRVVVDGSLKSFIEQRLHAAPAVRPSDVFFDCGDVRDQPPWFGTFYGNCKPSSSIVHKDVLVAGWLSPSSPYVNYSAPGQKDPETGKAQVEGLEDIHYNLVLDAVFLDRMYGVGGLSTALSNAVWPGNVENSPAPNSLPFATDSPITPGGPKGASFNSWILPCNSDELHGELNAWHVNDTTPNKFFTVHWRGRGQQPPFWVNPFPAAYPQAPDSDAWFPFNPLDPGGTGTPLHNGDYIVMRGTIWEENYHSGCGPNSPWSLPPTTGHDGITEMHPPDWIVRVHEPNPNARITTGHVAIASPQLSQDLHITAPPSASPYTTRKLQVRSIKRIDDARFINNASIVTASAQNGQDHVDVHVVVAPTGSQPARFKASWLVGWSEVDSSDIVWVDDQIPTGASPNGNGEDWDWITDNPFSGVSAHQSALAVGVHQHYFTGATTPMTVNWTDTLFAMVFLDPDHPPDEVMLQWHTPAGWIRAFWGDDLIPWGTPGSPDRLHIGALLVTGEWVRLEVSAQALGLKSGTVNIDGMAFTLSGGKAIWDYAGRNNAAEILQ